MCSGSGVLFVRHPCWRGIRPVTNDARDGVQMGFVQYARWKVVPALIIRSRFGVLTSGFACAPTQYDCIWSAQKTRKFGLDI
jgi:hypothetical protein